MYLSTKYGPDISSQVELDRLWNAIDVGEGVITPTDEWATANGLPHSAKFPWKDAQGIYEISAFHGIHCLVRCASSSLEIENPERTFCLEADTTICFGDSQRSHPISQVSSRWSLP